MQISYQLLLFRIQLSQKSHKILNFEKKLLGKHRNFLVAYDTKNKRSTSRFD